MKLIATSDTMNWNNIIKKEAIGINDTYLGIIKGISEPFIIAEKGTIIKEKFYIPKNLLEGYDDIVVHCRITKSEARNNFMRNSQLPNDDYYPNYKITDLNEEGKLEYNINEKNERNNTSVYYIGELIKNIKGTSDEMTEIIQSVARTAEQKIKEVQIVIKLLEEVNLETFAKEISNKIKRLLYVRFKVAAENISKMLQFAMRFTNSFEDIFSKIRRRTYLQQKA